MPDSVHGVLVQHASTSDNVALTNQPGGRNAADVALPEDAEEDIITVQLGRCSEAYLLCLSSPTRCEQPMMSKAKQGATSAQVVRMQSRLRGASHASSDSSGMSHWVGPGCLDRHAGCFRGSSMRLSIYVFKHLPQTLLVHK